MTYDLYYINEYNPKQYVISSPSKPKLINYLLKYASDLIDGDIYRFELVFNQFSQTYLLLSIECKTTDVMAEWSPMDNILDDLIEVMQEWYDLRFIVEEVDTDESMATQ